MAADAVPGADVGAGMEPVGDVSPFFPAGCVEQLLEDVSFFAFFGS